VVERVLGRLAALELLDDAAFAAWWVENRSQHRPRGRHALMQELSERGIAREVITAALAGLDEAVLALRVARRLAPRYSHLERPVFRRRLGALLQRRGFGQEAVYRAVEAAWQGREAPE
jgi:regulatory protein